MENLKLIAQKMVSEGKGILAADESTPTCTKRFNALELESTSSSRQSYRSMLFTSPELEKYISGVILFDETFHQNITSSEKLIPLFLKERGILTGIKVDTGAKNLANYTTEKITEGLDQLRERLQEYYKKGADFAKWRAVITIDNQHHLPSKACIIANAHALARYAALCQENNIVPIVEPEVLMEGNHNIHTCYDVTSFTLQTVFEQLDLMNVNLEAMVLKPNMILPGLNCDTQENNSKIAEMTFEVLNKHVPKKVPGVAFLSGGQSSDLAAERLNKLNKLYHQKRPWQLTFSYGRALQQDALLNWAKKTGDDAQKALINRAKMNHLASIGKLD
ncbi:MAG: fructose-bisphosphate aldolase class I [Flavobacteriales bacterium]|nr:fructose-bisphosphate aldolase class I [Flavobacteriales bacterium]|tara:strand:+ start:126 stop:1127 length:1002 start_codon:yes stop_codon:yes gene_type:complete